MTSRRENNTVFRRNGCDKRKIKMKIDTAEALRAFLCHDIEINTEFSVERSAPKNRNQICPNCLDFLDSQLFPHPYAQTSQLSKIRFPIGRVPSLFNLLQFDLPLWHIFGFLSCFIDFSYFPLKQLIIMHFQENFQLTRVFYALKFSNYPVATPTYFFNLL